MATNNSNNFSNPIGVNNGGTGVSSLTSYAPLIGGTTSTGALQQATTNFSDTGKILTSDGTTALWGGTSGLVLIKSKTLGLGTASVSFTSSDITSTYSSYLVKFYDIYDSSVSNSKFTLLFSTNNGSSYINTGYKGTCLYNPYNSTTLSLITASNSILYVAPNAGVSSKVVLVGEIYLHLPQSGVASYVGLIHQWLLTGSGSNFVRVYGLNTGTTFVNNIKFAFDANNIDSGTISLYGIKQ